MGAIRLLLALCVLSTHSQEAKTYFFGPGPAVFSFFIISGFYMALILDGKYKSVINFYVSRALRIYPVYWLALFLTIALGLIKIPLHIGGHQNSLIHYIQFSTHLSGKDYLIELGNYIVRNLTLIVTLDLLKIKDNIAAGYLILYQAWSLQVELLFYLLVPLILKVKKNFFSFTVAYCTLFYGIVLPFSLIPQQNLTFKLFNYLLYFLLGICAYKYIYINIERLKPTLIHQLIFYLLFFYITFYQFIPGKIVEHGLSISIIYYLAFSVSIPFVFVLTRGNKFDRFLGELSYPVYIFHLIFVKAYFSFPHPTFPLFNSFAIAFMTIIFSIIIVRFFQTPIDRFRHGITSS
jgi:peptidoglycan/LPS O-acetylase OafA/YrhL